METEVVDQLIDAGRSGVAVQPRRHASRIDPVLVRGEDEGVGDASPIEPVLRVLERQAPGLELRRRERPRSREVFDGTVGSVEQPSVVANQHVRRGGGAKNPDAQPCLPSHEPRAEGEVIREVIRERLGPGGQRSEVVRRRRH